MGERVRVTGTGKMLGTLAASRSLPAPIQHADAVVKRRIRRLDEVSKGAG
jgi:hypothetical protein